jgi:hypothetical protein
VRQIGTNALPVLMSWIRHEPTALERRSLVDILHLPAFCGRVFSRPQTPETTLAARGAEIIGLSRNPEALKEVALIASERGKKRGGCARLILQRCGYSQGNPQDLLAQMLQDPNPRLRRAATNALREMGHEVVRSKVVH